MAFQMWESPPFRAGRMSTSPHSCSASCTTGPAKNQAGLPVLSSAATFAPLSLNQRALSTLFVATATSHGVRPSLFEVSIDTFASFNFDTKTPHIGLFWHRCQKVSPLSFL